MGYLLVALLAGMAVAFAIQNPAVVTVRFLLWRFEEVPLPALVLGSVAAGLLGAGVPLGFRLWRARSRLRASEAGGRRGAPPGAAAPAEDPSRGGPG